MEIINVITIENDVIQEVKSFKKDDLDAAETYFIEKAMKYGWKGEEIPEEELLEEGRYETEFTVYANVNLVWSWID